MKFSCPRCGRNSEVDDDIGDFPVRCHRCAALLRRHHNSGLHGTPSDRNPFAPLLHAPDARPPSNLQRGTLADMLGARPPTEERDPPIIHAHSTTNDEIQPHTPTGHTVLTREARSVARHARARQQRLHRAMLEGSQRALGALGWVGLALVVLLGISVLVLQAQAASHDPVAPSQMARTSP